MANREKLVKGWHLKMKLSEIPAYLREAKKVNKSVVTALWEVFRQFQFNINIGDILLVYMLAVALANLYVIDLTYFPWFIHRSPAVDVAQQYYQEHTYLQSLLSQVNGTQCRIVKQCDDYGKNFSMLNASALYGGHAFDTNASPS